MAVRLFRKLQLTSRGSFSPGASILSGKGPQLLTWAGSRAARELKKTAIIVLGITPNLTFC
jgi:hypothetical protein